MRGVSGGLETGDMWSGELGRSVVTLSIRESCFIMGRKDGGFRRSWLKGMGRLICSSGVGVASRLSDRVLPAVLCFFSMCGLKRALRSAKSDVEVL